MKIRLLDYANVEHFVEIPDDTEVIRGHIISSELRDLALGAYTEEELTEEELPKTWEEFCRTHNIMPTEALIDDTHSSVHYWGGRSIRDEETDRNVLPSMEAAEAHLALMQLHQLRNCYRQGWVPDYNSDTPKYYVYIDCAGISVGILYRESRFLTFEDSDTAVKFATRFPDLIKNAGDLI